MQALPQLQERFSIRRAQMRLKIQMPTSAKAQLATELEQQQATIETRDFVGSQAS